MLAGVPFAFPFHLDPRAVDQQVKRTLRPPMRDVHAKGLLATAERAEIRHVPVQADQAKQALDEACRLPQRHAENDLHRQASLDGSVAVDGLSPTLACRLRRPLHVRIEPDRQRSATLERLVIRGPAQGLVGRCLRSAHTPKLSRWIHKMNPSRDLRNRADARDQSASCLGWVTGHILLIRLQQRPLFGFLVNPFGTTARATELQGDHLLVTAQSRSAIFSKLATIPVVCRSGSLNRTLMVRQNCTAAS